MKIFHRVDKYFFRSNVTTKKIYYMFVCTYISICVCTHTHICLMFLYSLISEVVSVCQK